MSWLWDHVDGAVGTYVVLLRWGKVFDCGCEESGVDACGGLVSAVSEGEGGRSKRGE